MSRIQFDTWVQNMTAMTSSSIAIPACLWNSDESECTAECGGGGIGHSCRKLLLSAAARPGIRPRRRAATLSSVFAGFPQGDARRQKKCRRIKHLRLEHFQPFCLLGQLHIHSINRGIAMRPCDREPRFADHLLVIYLLLTATPRCLLPFLWR